MNLTYPGLDLANLTRGGFDAVQFSLIGILVVFLGLTLIAAYIALLPWILSRSSREKARNCPAPSNDEPESLDAECLLAIATALHLYQFSTDDNGRITWERHSKWDSSWQRAGRFEAMHMHGQDRGGRS